MYALPLLLEALGKGRYCGNAFDREILPGHEAEPVASSSGTSATVVQLNAAQSHVASPVALTQGVGHDAISAESLSAMITDRLVKHLGNLSATPTAFDDRIPGESVARPSVYVNTMVQTDEDAHLLLNDLRKYSSLQSLVLSDVSFGNGAITAIGNQVIRSNLIMQGRRMINLRTSTVC
jgi:hypothetical protein